VREAGGVGANTPESATTLDGELVHWVNASTDEFSEGHTVTSCTPSACFGAPANTGGDTFNIRVGGGWGDNNSFTFGSAGTYTYYCKIHGYNSMHGTITVSGVDHREFQDSSAGVTYDSWSGVSDSSASGGAYRTSATRNAEAAFKFTGTGVTWVTRKGPDQGIASVRIDGVSKGYVDLYAPTAQPFSQAYAGLSSATHTVIIGVTGTANAAAKAASVAIDAFVVGSSTKQESSPSVTYDKWTGASNANASRGTFRDNPRGGTASLIFSGRAVDWITAMGPSYGFASVSIDGVDKGTVDLYSPSVTWHVFESYAGLAAGKHTIVITALGTHDASSTGTRVVVDELLVQTNSSQP